MNAARDVKIIVDVGWGRVGSTQPHDEDQPDKSVPGVELFVPCRRVAALRAAELQAQNVTNRQMNATKTGLLEGERDIGTWALVLHGIPPSLIRTKFKDSQRPLAPGGPSIKLDLLMCDDQFREWVDGLSARNNEPFPVNRMNNAQSHRDVGFDDVEIVPGREFDSAASSAKIARFFPWMMIIAREAD